jgi:hypothetical protein
VLMGSPIQPNTALQFVGMPGIGGAACDLFKPLTVFPRARTAAAAIAEQALANGLSPPQVAYGFSFFQIK